MKARLGVTHPANLCTIAEIYRPSVIFLLLIVWVYLHSLIHNQPQKKLVGAVRYGRSKSFKVIAIGTNREKPYAKYIVHYCDTMPIFYRFRDMTIHWSKI